MPNWLFEVVNPWTTPAALVGAVTAVAWTVRIRGRNLAFVALSTAVGVVLWQAWKAGPPNGLLDLQIYTNAARSWVDGNSLYDYADPVFGLSATYPPIGPLLFSVLTPLTADGREVVFTAISLLALFGSAWSVAGLAGVRSDQRVTWTAWAFTAAAVSIPVWLTFRQGQVNCVLWFLVLADLDALRRGRRWSGAGVGLATAIKLIPGLFLIWFALTKRWVATAIGIASFIAATGVGWILTPSDSKIYWTQLLWDSDRVGSVSDSRNNSVLSLVSRVSDGGTLQTSLWLLVSIVVLAVAAMRSLRASRANDFLAVAAIVGCASAAVSPITWTHHLGFLLVALAAFFVSAKTRRSQVLCGLAWLILVDPGGHGDGTAMSTIRALFVIGAVCFTPIREGFGGDQSCAPATPKDLSIQTETAPTTRETKSMLPS